MSKSSKAKQARKQAREQKQREMAGAGYKSRGDSKYARKQERKGEAMKTTVKILRETVLVNALAAFFRVTLRNYPEGRTRKWSAGLEVVRLKGYIQDGDGEKFKPGIIYEYCHEPAPLDECEPRKFYAMVAGDGSIRSIPARRG